MTQVATKQDPLLETAERCLLAPFDLEAAALGRVFGLLGAHRIDDADLYFQATQSESWRDRKSVV